VSGSGNSLGDMVDDDLATELGDERVNLTPAGHAAAGWGGERRPGARFSVQHVGRVLVLRPLDDAAEMLLGLGPAALRLRAHVEVLPVGEADGSAGSLTEAGTASRWGSR